MSVLILIIIVLLGLAVGSGFHKSDAYALAIDVNTLKTPYFAFGIHYRQYILLDQEVGELTIGLIFLNLVIEFYKEQ